MSGPATGGSGEELTFLEVFDTYFEEVAKLKLAVERQSAPPEDDDDDEEEIVVRPKVAEATLTSEAVRRRLIRKLEEISADYGRHTESFEYQQFRQVLYIMAALADEVFLAIDWPGRDEWRDNLIEEELFDSHDAGERFFDLLDDLLAARDSAHRNVAVIYLLALSLGFQGRFAAVDHAQESLDDYRRRLYSFVYGARPGRRLEGTNLAPQAHWYTITGAKAERFPSIAKWFGIGAVVFVVLLLVSHAVWVFGTAELNQVLLDIQGAP